MYDNDWDNDNHVQTQEFTKRRDNSNWPNDSQPHRKYKNNGGRENKKTPDRKEKRERAGNWGSRCWGNDDVKSIKVPSKFVGRIIGRGGVKINNLRFKSKANIIITKETEGDKTLIMISGTAGAVSKAVSLIGELIVEMDSYAPRQGLKLKESTQQKPHTVTQIIELMPDDDEEKFKAFMDFARNLDSSEKVIVFCRTKARAIELSTELILAGINCQAIYKDQDQNDKKQALTDIAKKTVQILVTTDVALQGLDIDNITQVVSFDLTRNIEEYARRVARTRRAGKSGTSITYCTRNNWAHVTKLCNIFKKAQQYGPEELSNMAEQYAD